MSGREMVWGPDKSGAWWKAIEQEIPALTDEQVAAKIGALGEEIARYARDPNSDAWSPEVVLAVRWLTVALEDYHGKSIWHGDHDFNANLPK
jgi:hypothetical protein